MWTLACPSTNRVKTVDPLYVGSRTGGERSRDGRGLIRSSRLAGPAVTGLLAERHRTLFALGAGDRVVGVSNRCRYPPAVLTLLKIGTYTKPDPEKIALLHPIKSFKSLLAGPGQGSRPWA